MVIHFTNEALKDIKYWKRVNNITIQKRISMLLEEIAKHQYEGIGNPEQLKHQLSGYWSRRINKEHRIIYKVMEERVNVISLRFHY